MLGTNKFTLKNDVSAGYEVKVCLRCDYKSGDHILSTAFKVITVIQEANTCTTSPNHKYPPTGFTWDGVSQVYRPNPDKVELMTMPAVGSSTDDRLLIEYTDIFTGPLCPGDTVSIYFLNTYWGEYVYPDTTIKGNIMLRIGVAGG